MGAKGSLTALERIQNVILLIRGERVILDKDLASLYGVTTGNLNKAITRNIDRLKFHFGTSSWGGTRKRPRAFSEQGVAMLSSVLRSTRAVHVNIEIMRTFVRLREMVAGHADLVRRLDDLERKYDAQFRSVFDAIRALISEEIEPHKRIGFIGGM